MRGNSQAASARLRADTPAQRWTAWLTRTREQRRRTRMERLETIARMQAEARHAQRAGSYHPRLHSRL
jgi:hypothetical protein